MIRRMGVAYTVLQPIVELLKNPVTALLIMAVLAGSGFLVSSLLPRLPPRHPPLMEGAGEELAPGRPPRRRWLERGWRRWPEGRGRRMP